MNLRFKILTPIIALILASVSVSALLSYRESAEQLREALVDNMRGESSALARAVNQMTETTLEHMAQIPQRQEIQAFYAGNLEDKAAAEQFSKELQTIVKGYGDIDRISLLNPSGITLSSSTTSAIGQSFADRDYFKAAIRGEVFISQPLKSRISGKGAVIASAPVKVNGKIVGVAYASIGLDRFFESFVQPVKVGKAGYAFLLAGNGLIAVHKNPEYLFKELPTTPIYKEMIAAPDPGMREYTGVNGNTVFNYFNRDNRSGLTAIVQAESGDVFAGLVGMRNLSIMVCCISVILGAILVYFILWPILNILNRCNVFAARVAEGDFSGTLVHKRKDELGRLADALRAIPDRLRDFLAMANTLSQKVRVGHLQERLEANSLPGSYSDLAGAINTLSQSYTAVIDLFPPLMACDDKHKILFLNSSAQGIVDGNHIGDRCAAHIHAPECDSDRCFGRACMTGGNLTQETVVTPCAGRLDVSVAAVPIRDDLGKSVGYYEFFMNITEIKEIERTIIKVGDEAAVIADRVASAAEKLAAQVTQVTRGSETQKERMESTASAMTEMNSTVLEVARNAANASEQSESTRDKAETGSELVNRVVEAIGKVNHVTESLQTNMSDLGVRAESIGGIMNVISDIADQTNLLALNAAIEAARAGEAGRGFAVVADEVRKLAEKTMTATHEVGTNISGIQNSARVNIEEVEKAAKSITEATELASTSGESLSRILELATANSAVVASIATAAEEQSATSEEISRAITEVNRIVVETSEGMSHASSAVQELAEMAQQLNRVMERLKN